VFQHAAFGGLVLIHNFSKKYLKPVPMRKLAAIMFSDIAGYSAMMSKDEKIAMKMLEKNRAIHKSFITKYNGQYIKEIGDGTLAIFQSSFDAVHCAVQIRNACSREPGLGIRIGIHIGDIVYQENDVFGDSVNIASRIEAAGEPGGIFISEKVYDDIRNKEGLTADFYGEKNLKNIPDPVRIYRVTTTEGAEASLPDYEMPGGIARGDTAKRKKQRALIFLIPAAILLLITAFILYPSLFSRDKLKEIRSADGKISVAVLPFFNMTNDSTWNIWQEGIQDMLITSLSNSKELKVRQFESINNLIQSKGVVNYASLTPSFAGDLSQKLDAGIFIFGNIKKSGNFLRISAQLIDSRTQEVFKSFQIDGNAEETALFPILDSLTRQVKDFLLISSMEKELTPDYQRLANTANPDAYRNFIHGKKAFSNMDFNMAYDFLTRAVEIDSNFTVAFFMLSITNMNLGNYAAAKAACMRIYAKKDKEPLLIKIMINALYAMNFESPREENTYLKQLVEIDDQNPMFYYQLGNNFIILEQYDKAIPELEKSIQIYKTWETKPDWIYHYWVLTTAYYKTGQLEKAKEVMQSAERDFPGNPRVNYLNAILSLVEVDTVNALANIERWTASLKESGQPEEVIAYTVGNIYLEAALHDKAESYYRKAYSIAPNNPAILNALGYFLVNTDRNVDEGVALLERAIEIDPEDYLLLDSKGWGLYKQGKYKDALELIEQSWDESPVYNHEIYVHLQAAKTAVKAE
jgi:class 3 adenylate cyclase/tetratricopeptide (TPR) repeat protein